MSDCGYLIASHYDVVLYYLGTLQCLTFLPLRSDPISTPLCAGDPDVGSSNPPIAIFWYRYRYNNTSDCALPSYERRIEEFRLVVSSSVTT